MKYNRKDILNLIKRSFKTNQPKKCCKQKINLSRTDLSGINFNNQNLYSANLSGIDLTEANLVETNFIWADLNGAILTGAKCDRSHFHFASLLWADLTGASLREADFSCAKASQANLTGVSGDRIKLMGAILDGAILADGNFQADRKSVV